MTKPVLVSRHATPAVAEPAPSGGAMELLEVELRRAQAIARAKDALPRSYRENPGAVLLADQWARSRGIDTLTAIQSVSFVDGKPIVDAAMQRALAERAGYEVRVFPGDTEATVVILKGGAEIGRETFSLDDAKRQGLTGKQTWQRTPRNMLVARATTNALKFHAPSVLLGLATEDDVMDPTEVLAPVQIDGPGDGAPPTVADPRPVPTADADTGEIIDAEIVEPVDEPEQTAMLGDTITVADLKAAQKLAGVGHGDVIRWASEHCGEQVPNLTAIAGRQDLAAAVLDWLQAPEGEA